MYPISATVKIEASSPAHKIILGATWQTILSLYIKRALDLTMAFTAFFFFSLIMAVVAFLIKLDSRGPIFFKQERVGAKWRRKGGQIVWEIQSFRCYKFRSMFHDTDQTVHESYVRAYVRGEAAATADANAQFKLDQDPRITRVGKWLRKMSLDELPQLINIARGEMSLVGPRPVPTYEVAEYSPQHYERFTALPGLTGLWQVYGRGQVTFDEMINFDLKYVQNRSLWLDLKIICLTVPAVFAAKGAK